MSNSGNDDRPTYVIATDRHGARAAGYRALRIVSDGTEDGTRVVDAQTGQPIDMVTAVVLRLRAGEPAEAIIHLFDPEVALDITADPKPGKGKAADARRGEYSE